MKREPRVPCPTPRKNAHRTAYEARVAARQAAMRRNREGRLCAPLYVYRCPCRKWHLTRRRTGPEGQENELAVLVPVDLQRWAMPRT